MGTEGVELLGGTAETQVKGKGKVAGPTTGDDAPLFGKEPDTPCTFAFKKGCVVIEFDKPTQVVELDRQQAVFFVDLLLTHARQLRATTRTGADADGETTELVAKWKRSKGKLVVTFEDKKRAHQLTKPEAKLLAAHLRAEISALPLLKG